MQMIFVYFKLVSSYHEGHDKSLVRGTQDCHAAGCRGLNGNSTDKLSENQETGQYTPVNSQVLTRIAGFSQGCQSGPWRQQGLSRLIPLHTMRTHG